MRILISKACFGFALLCMAPATSFAEKSYLCAINEVAELCEEALGAQTAPAHTGHASWLDRNAVELGARVSEEIVSFEGAGAKPVARGLPQGLDHAGGRAERAAPARERLLRPYNQPSQPVTTARRLFGLFRSAVA